MGIVVFALLALVALAPTKIRLTRALARSRVTNAAVQRVLWRALTRLTCVRFGLIWRAPETRFALFTVVSEGVTLAVLANATANVIAINVH